MCAGSKIRTHSPIPRDLLFLPYPKPASVTTQVTNIILIRFSKFNTNASHFFILRSYKHSKILQMSVMGFWHSDLIKLGF